ncbi:hypothetical protein AB0L57_16965 [Nocardia sp. NPDC052254]|uniref:hypothetical protein n=1 Tax=Nocardia sp. NPDC052254 TaxID=3155681 RepID=UPI0034183B52
MVNPYQPGYPAAPPPPGPAWGAPPNFAAAQPFPRPAGGRAPLDIVAGIALAVAAVLGVAQSLWALFGSGRDYGFWQYGSGVAMIIFWVCSAFALVGGILVIAKGSGDFRVRTVASLGTGALFITFAQRIATICTSRYAELSEDGNWLCILVAIAVLVAAGALIAGIPAPSPTWPSVPGGRFPVASPAPGYPGAAPFAAMPPGPAPHWQPPGAVVPPPGYAVPGHPAGYPGVPAPSHGVPVAPAAGSVPAGGAASAPFPPAGSGTPNAGPDAGPMVAPGDG